MGDQRYVRNGDYIMCMLQSQVYETNFISIFITNTTFHCFYICFSSPFVLGAFHFHIQMFLLMHTDISLLLLAKEEDTNKYNQGQTNKHVLHFHLLYIRFSMHDSDLFKKVVLILLK